MVKLFCKTCGVNVSNIAADLDEEQVSKLGDPWKGMHQRAKTRTPLNLRVLNGYNVAEIKKPEQATKGALLGEPYVNP